ncbi:hypothetical protein TNCV_1573151 [Trichonephila clavipes]|uniref:Tc1-like transposase DDE domain-containing protein n=1 Tax=Trichonephila clavipes TaxID=2585209 RepID=A0A8X6VPC4_TRICX|nr:hypothetical protein TNCV_1573151 [Trichonephila clavipes]
MLARHHLSDYDRELLEAGQSVTTVAAAAKGVSKNVISPLKRPMKVEILCESMSSRSPLGEPTPQFEKRWYRPPYSSNLNPFEHAWDALSRRVAQRTISIGALQELKTTLRAKWDNIPQRLLDRLVKSMKNRCKMCIRVHGQRVSY